MNFKFGTLVSYNDKFAVYKGRITGKQTKIDWPFFWRRHNWYMVNLHTINDEFVMGYLSIAERDLELLDDPPTEKSKRKSNVYSIRRQDNET